MRGSTEAHHATLERDGFIVVEKRQSRFECFLTYAWERSDFTGL